MNSYTVCYTRTESGYMGQLLEWPEVISEGATLEECRAMVEDAAREMIAVCKEDGRPIPQLSKRTAGYLREAASFVCCDFWASST